MTHSASTHPKSIEVWLVEDDSNCAQEYLTFFNSVSDLHCAKVFVTFEEVEDFARALQPVQVPDAVIMDIKLPGIDGIEGAIRLKQIIPNVPIIMLTNLDTADVLYRALKAGASGYLIKDTPYDQIITAIRETVYRGGMLMPARVAKKTMRFFTRQRPRQDYGLTDREKEVLQLMCDGISKRDELAQKLFISAQTVNNHLRKIYDKLHVHSATDAVSKAFRESLINWRILLP